MTKRKIGIGTFSLLLSLFGIVWNLHIRGFNMGGVILNFFGLNAGVRLTVLFSLIFFVPAFLIAVKYQHDFGVKTGKILSAVMVSIIVLSSLFLSAWNIDITV